MSARHQPAPTNSPSRTQAGPQAASQPVDTTAVGDPKVAARKGVLSALRPDPQTGDGRTPVAWLRIAAPTSWMRVFLAESWCSCGRHRKARGKADVLQLIADHTAHRTVRPLRTVQEGRAAA
jgi:hypothetical protein